MKKLFLIPAALTTLFCTNANAAEIKPFAGFSINYSEFDGDSEDMEIVEDTLASFTVSGGLRFNRYFSAEAFYQKSGREDKINTGYYLISTGTPVSIESKVRFDAFGIDLKGYVPTSIDRLTVFGAIGLAQYKFKETLVMTELLSGQSLSEKGSEKNTGYRFGVGAEFRLTDNWSLNVAGRYVKLNNGSDNVIDDLSEVSFGAKYTF